MDKRFEQIPVSDKLDCVVDHCLEQLRQEQRTVKRKRIQKTCISIGTAAAIFISIVFFSVSNPDAAESIPLLAGITQMVQKEGNRPIQEYIRESNGVRIKISDIYHDYNTIYMAVKIDNKHGFPKEMLSASDESECGKLELLSKVQFDFYDQPIDVSPYTEGNFIDDHTYIGDIHIPLSSLPSKLRAQSGAIPKEFGFSWDIHTIYDWPFALWEYANQKVGPTRFEIMPNNGQGGNWNFQVHVPLNLNS